jgi:hypothetical protein
MSDEPNIPGVPEGWRIVRVREMNAQYSDPYFEAILERIPKPKKRVLVAEWDLQAEPSVYDSNRPKMYLPDATHSPDGYVWANRHRIEERDA